jgi:hypothetical protein
MKYHLEKAITVITRIENEHLDYTAQMRRLEDVASRFGPLMHRLDMGLPSIQSELGLPTTALTIAGARGPAHLGGILLEDALVSADIDTTSAQLRQTMQQRSRVEELEHDSHIDSSNTKEDPAPQSTRHHQGAPPGGIAEPKYPLDRSQSVASGQSKAESAVCILS